MSTSPYKLPAGTAAPSYDAPSDAVVDTEQTMAWYIQWARWASTFYNTTGVVDAVQNGSGQNPTPRPGIHDDVKTCFKYYFGEQENIDFNYLTEDRTGTTTQAPWIKGKHAAKLIDFLKGPASQLLNAVDWSAKSLNPVTVRDKETLFTKAEIKTVLKEAFEMAERLGVEFNPVDKDFNSLEELDDWRNNYMAPGEEAIVLEANQIWENNICKFLYLRTWLHVLVGGVGAVHNYIENGRLRKDHIDSWQLIFDNRRDGEFGDRQQFRGFIQYMSPGEILGRSGWLKQLQEIDGAVDEIRNCGNGNSFEGFGEFTAFYNQGSPFTWWNHNANETEIAVMTLYFIAPRGLRFKKSRNRYGETRVSRIRPDGDDVEIGDWTTGDLHRIVLIGNKYALDWGPAPNVVREFGNRSNPIIPITMISPNMVGGRPRGTMTLLKSNQDEIDRLSHKIRELTGKDIGKAVAFRVPMGDNANHLKIADELKDVGVTVIPYNPDLPDELKTQKWIEVVDASQGQYIQQYLTLRDAEQKTMEEILNLSKNALGMMSGYISKGAQQNAVQYSSMGTSYLFEALMQFVERDMRFAANQQKLVRAITGRDEHVLFSLGPAGVKYMTYTKSMRYEETMLYLKVNDVVDESARMRILGYAQAWSQNIEFMVGADDILMLESEKTFSGMIRKLRHSMRVKARKQEETQAQQQLLDMIGQEKSAHDQAQMEAMRQNGARAINADNNRMKAAELMLGQAGAQLPQQ